MSEYIKAKKLIFKNQNRNDFLILNDDDPIVRNFSKNAAAEIIYYSINNKPKNLKFDNYKLLGDHNLANLLAAIEVSKILKVPVKVIEKSLKSFSGVSMRQEFVKEINGVKYFNDTTATMPDAVKTAINVFLDNFPDSRLILICGGQNKGLKYTEMAKIIKERVDEVIMLPGTASEKIKEGLGNYTRLHEVASMQEAIKKSKELAKKGDVVILSPGGASFNLFKNEFDRGRQFVEGILNTSHKKNINGNEAQF
jgi:UDP-N-acetylmuramoylalanine--D-glutamate ligase